MDIFRPDKFRYFSWYLLCFTIGQFFIVVPIVVALQFLSGDQINLAPVMIASFFITIGWAIGIFIATANHVAGLQIVISDAAITGPSLWFNRRVQISSNDLDKEKSCRQNLFQRILGFRLIQSKTGQKILFAERTFDKNQAAMILDTLGCARSGIA